MPSNHTQNVLESLSQDLKLSNFTLVGLCDDTAVYFQSLALLMESKSLFICTNPRAIDERSRLGAV